MFTTKRKKRKIKRGGKREEKGVERSYQVRC